MIRFDAFDKSFQLQLIFLGSLKIVFSAKFEVKKPHAGNNFSQIYGFVNDRSIITQNISNDNIYCKALVSDTS